MYGSFLRVARERAGLSVAEGARLSGVTPDAIRKFEKDENSPSIATLDKLAQAYRCLAGDLLPNSGSGDAMFEPIAAALLGLTDEEAREQISFLASQVRVFRNALTRRIAQAATLKDGSTSSMEWRNESITNALQNRPVGKMEDNPRSSEQLIDTLYGGATPPEARSPHAANRRSTTELRAKKR